MNGGEVVQIKISFHFIYLIKEWNFLSSSSQLSLHLKWDAKVTREKEREGILSEGKSPLRQENKEITYKI